MRETGTTWSTFRDIRYRPSRSDASAWEYLPRVPALRRDPAGRPALTLHERGDAGHLMLTATWGAPEPDLAALRLEVATRTATAPGLVRVAFAAVTGVRCELLVGDGSGAFTAVSSSATSGIPPYDALFAVTLRGDALAAARAATAGERGRLTVAYEAQVAAPRESAGDACIATVRFDSYESDPTFVRTVSLQKGLPEPVRAVADVGSILAAST